MADTSSSEHIVGTMGAHWGNYINSDASGSFWGSLKGARIPYVIVKQRDFLVFRDFDDVVVFYRTGCG